MSWFLQFVYIGLIVVGVVMALWVGLWLLLGFFALGVAMVVWVHVRDYLLKKGILNPRPGIPPEGIIIEREESTTVIEGDYSRVEEKKE